MKHKVSIIIPIYRAEKYIRKCLDSFFNQTLKEIEIILIDDLGGDNSIKIAEEYAQKDSRIKIIYNETNLGEGRSRNVGIENAKGEYIAFADPDDWVDLDFYEKLYEEAKKQDYDIVKSERIKIYPDDNNKKEFQKVLNKLIKRQMKAGLPYFLLFTYEHTTAIFKRNYIIENNVKYSNIRNGPDNIFLLQASFYAKSLSLIDNTYYYYRIIKSSVTHQIDKEYFTSQLKIVEMEIDFLNSKNITKEHYLLFIKQSLYILHSKIEQIPNEGELAKFKNEFVYKIINIFNNIKYINEDKIIDIIDVIIGEKSNIFKKILKILIKRETRRRIRIFLNKE